jgi:serine/threonine protein kinase
MYIAPERIHGVNDDPRSDIYALGMVLYYCITGKPPFAEDTVLRILQAQKSKEPQAIEELVPTCPPALIQIFKKMTAKRLEDRFSSMGVLLQSIEEYFRAKENAVITAQQLQEKKQIYKEIALTQLSKEKKEC